MKILINDCYGGFGLSEDVVLDLFELGICRSKPTDSNVIIDIENSQIYYNKKPKNLKEVRNGFYTEAIYGGDVFYKDGMTHQLPYGFDGRTNEALIKLVEEKGSHYCSGHCSSLKVIEIPDDVKYTVEEYDGIEWIAEVHRTWR